MTHVGHIPDFIVMLAALLVARLVWATVSSFFSEPESLRGWVLRGVVVWIIGRLSGLV